MTCLLQLHNKCSKIPPSTSVHFATPVPRSRVVRLSYDHFCLCGHQHPRCERAIRLARPPFFCKVCFSSNPTNKKSQYTGKNVAHQIQTFLSRRYPFRTRHMLYALFWVIPRRLNFICRRFGIVCSIFIGR